MMTATPAPPATACPECAAPLPCGAPAGLCPRCLLRLTLAEDALAPGPPRQVLGDYEIFEELARGGMGIVYRARQRRLDRAVAVKVLRGGEFAGLEAQARFRTEAAAVARLQHPGIVAIHDVGEEDGVLWFSMDLVPGENLAVQTRENPFPAPAAAECVRRVAEAVQHAHENGVLHRDLKPSNILLGGDAQPRVTDFGLARRIATDTTSGAAELTRTGQMLGSPGYAAPEQVLGGKADARTDVYGLGAVLYHLLTGRPPFQGPTLDSILLQLRENDPLPPRRLNPTVPRDLETICLQALRKDPARRYATAREVAAELARFLDGTPIRARPVSALERTARWARRRPAVAALMAVLVLGAGIAFGLIDAARRVANRANVQLGETVDFIELQRAEELFHNGESAQAIGVLARMLQRHPAHPVAGPRLASALWQGEFAPPRLSPFFVGDKVWWLHLLGDQKTLLVSTQRGPALWAAEEGERRLTFEHDGKPLSHYVLSPDERTLVGWESTPGETLSLWDVATGKKLMPPLVHPDWLHNVVFSPDSARFLIVGAEAAVRWREARTGRPVGLEMVHPGGLLGAALSTDGRLLAIGQNRTVHLWDASTGGHLRAFDALAETVLRLLISPDGRWILATDFHGTARLFTTDGQPAGLPIQLTENINDIAFSPDSRRLVTAANDHTARVWSVPDCAPISAPMRHRDYVGWAAFSPDGRSVVTGSGDNTARVWDAETGRPLTQSLHHMEQPRAAAFTADGSTLITSGAGGIVLRWALPDGRARPGALAHTARVNAAEWSPDGTLIATGGEDNVAVAWDSATLQPAARHPHVAPVHTVVFAPDSGAFLTLDDHGVGTKQARASEMLRNYLYAPGSQVISAAFSPDGRLIAAGEKDGSTLVWDAATSSPRNAPPKQDGEVVCVRFSPDGKTLLTAIATPDSGAGTDGARLWDAATAAPLGQPMRHEDDVVDAVFSPDGALVATAGNDNVARVWDARTGAPISPPLPHERTVCAVAFSPDSRVLATASWDGFARLWDARTGQPLARPLRHEDRVLDVRFSPDGRRLATASKDQTARLWDVASGLPVSEPLRHTTPVRQVRFHPDGQRLLTLAGDETARVWEVPAYTGPPPAWLAELAEEVALNDLPHDPATAFALLTRYRATIGQALATPAASDFGRLARRIFGEPPLR